MSSGEIDLEQLLPGNSLLLDYLHHFDRLADFYRYSPADPQGWVAATAVIDQFRDTFDRDQLAAVLAAQNQAFGCGKGTLHHIEQLRDPSSCVIATGQQVGIFTGPLYTIYKTLTTLKLAQTLSARYQRPYLPIFWLSSDDHDFEEVNHIYILDQRNQVVRLEFQPDQEVARKSTAHIHFEQGLGPLIEAIDVYTPATEFKPQIMAWLHGCCDGCTSLSQGFGQLMARLFNRYGLILVDPMDPGLKAMMRPVFLKELSHPQESSRHVLEASARLQELGYGAQIKRQAEDVNLFFHENQRRHSITYRQGKFRIGGLGICYDSTTMQRLAREEPTKFSQNVVTRPLIQDTLFPTVAYVAGPGEISYFAQLKGVYQAFGVPMPIIYPRASMTLVEGKVAKILDKYNLQPTDFFGNVFALEKRLIQEEIPDSVRTLFEHSQTTLATTLDQIERTIVPIDTNLGKVVDAAHRRFEHELNKIAEKTLQAYRRKNQILHQQMLKAANNLYPREHPQERVFNIFMYLIRYGMELLGRLFDEIEVGNFHHKIIPM